MNNAVWIIKYIAELKMFDRSAQYKTKCAYWQCRLSELTNTLFTLTKRASHIFYLVSSLPKKWILTFNKFSNLQRFFCRIQQKAKSLKHRTSVIFHGRVSIKPFSINIVNPCCHVCSSILLFKRVSIEARMSNSTRF